MARTIKKNTNDVRQGVFWLPRIDKEFQFHYYAERLKAPALSVEQRRQVRRNLRRTKHNGQPRVRHGLVGATGRSMGVGGVALRYLECMLDACLLHPESYKGSHLAWRTVISGTDRAFVHGLYPKALQNEIERKATWFVGVFTKNVKIASLASEIREEIENYLKDHPDHLQEKIADTGMNKEEFETNLLDILKVKLKDLFKRLSG